MSHLAGGTLEHLYRPDEEPYIRCYAELESRIPNLIELFAARPPRDRKLRVFNAWVHWQNDGAGDIAMGYGPLAFYERFVRALEDAQQGLEMILRDHANDYKDQIEPIDEIGSCNDPDQLIKMYDGERFGVEYRADELARFEIVRKLTIACQLMCIGCADPYERVTNDLTTTNLLAAKRLFTGRKVQVAVGFVLDAGRHSHLDQQYPIHVSRDTAARFVWPKAALGRQRVYSCRTIEDAGVLYEVQTDSRPKPRISGVIKLERGGRLNDRRGLKHNVVAVENCGQLRAATFADAEVVADIARKQLWHSPLREERDESGPNVYSSPDYKVTKIVGRLETNHGFSTAAPVEHQLTSIEHDLTAEFATDGVGHRHYRQRVVRDFILPRWFPTSVFGIDWLRELVAP